MSNLLKDRFPDIFSEIDFDKNKELNLSKEDIEQLTYGSKKKIWFKCKNNHSYITSIAGRTLRNRGCCYCSNQKVLNGYNDLQTIYPEIVKEWDFNKNKIKPDEVTGKSGQKVWWKCKNNHSYQATIHNRTVNNTGCPYCSGRLPIKGKTDLQTLFPELIKEWDFDKNKIKPDEVMKGSNKKVWWKCKNGHSWETTVINRTNNRNCPYCFGRLPIKGKTDLQTLYPGLIKEWDFHKNEIKPDEVMRGSDKKVWWICENNHSYFASISNRTILNRGCPYCSSRRVLRGYNDLQTLYPDLINEWDFEKNKIKPDEIMPKSSKKVWWKCDKGHSWETKIAHRTYSDSDCPYCCLNQTSKAEQSIFNEIKSLYKDSINRKRHKINNKFYETDIYIPSLNIGIEYNGKYWHKDRKDKDKEKEKILSSKMKLFYILEDNENKIFDNKIYFNYKNQQKDNFIWAKNELLKMIQNFCY